MITAAILATILFQDSAAGVSSSNSMQDKGFFAFQATTIDGKNQPFKLYTGKVVLVVNVASKCGLTPQYAKLQALYKKYSSQGFIILGFPSNNFKEQEPGSDADIKKFCTLNYGVTFPMFSKIDVNGENRVPLYEWLIKHAPTHNDIEWNFEKFLISKDGQVAARFAPKVEPDDKQVIEHIEKLIAVK